ncbi:MAG: NUDIX hydrolase [Fuerstiella sp.]|nr:NUDIX hydrolase [Fuerstiella sp.]
MNIPISKFENFRRRIPEGDDHERSVCDRCGWIHYENPRVIAAALCIEGDQVLLCRRAILPRYGFWTLPGGFMEMGETAENAAVRESFEEAGARVAASSLLGVYSIPRIGQVHLVYLTHLNSPEIVAGTESLEVAMVSLKEIPWDELAFPVNHWTLQDYLSLEGRPPAQPFSVTPDRLEDRLPPVDCHPDYTLPKS